MDTNKQKPKDGVETGDSRNFDSTDLLSPLRSTIEGQRAVIEIQAKEYNHVIGLLKKLNLIVESQNKELSDAKKELSRARKNTFSWLLNALTPELRFKR